MKISLLLLTTLALAMGTAWGVVYYSQGSLAPDLLSSWNTERSGGGSQPQNFTSGDTFVVQDGHNMVTSASWSVSGTGAKIQIENNATLQADHLISVPNFQIDDGGIYIHNAPSASSNGSPSDVPGSQSRSFAAGSTVEFRKWANGGTAPVPLPNVAWGNLTINVATLAGSWNQTGYLQTVNGNLIIQSTGGTREFRMAGNQSFTANIAGDLIISGGILNCGNGSSSGYSYIINLSGNYIQSGGTFTSTSTANLASFNFTGVDGQFSISGGTITTTYINWSVGASAKLTLNSDLTVSSGRSFVVNGYLDCHGENAISGEGSFVLNAGATLGVGSDYSLDGNIQININNLTFDPGADFVFHNHPIIGHFGTNMPETVNNITLDLVNDDDVIYPQTSVFTINGQLDIIKGYFDAYYLDLTLCNPIANQRSHLITNEPLSTNIIISGTGSNIILPSSLNSLGGLMVNNPNGLALENDLYINDSLKLSQGILNTSSHTIALSSDAVILESENSYVLGTVQKTKELYQNTNDDFGGLGIELEAAGGDPGQTTVARVTGSAIVQGSIQSIKRYFHIEPTNNVGMNATMIFHYWDSELNGINENDLALFRSSNFTSWGRYGEGGTVDTDNNTVTATGIDSFSYWTLGDKNNPLAVDLASFSALASDGAITLSWRTESENGSYQWIVERSEKEAGPYVELGRLPAAGTSQTPKDYSYSDATAQAGRVYYYRLGELSQDGRMAYFGPVSCSVNRSLPQADMLLGCVPNPFRQMTEIRYQIAGPGKVSLKIYNLAGQCVKTLVSEFKIAGYYMARWDGRDDEGRRLAAGVYVYRLQTGGRDFCDKLQLVH